MIERAGQPSILKKTTVSRHWGGSYDIERTRTYRGGKIELRMSSVGVKVLFSCFFLPLSLVDATKMGLLYRTNELVGGIMALDGARV